MSEATKTDTKSVEVLRGTFPHRLGELSVDEASAKMKTSPTAPGTLRIVAAVATHRGEQPLLRSDLAVSTGLEQGSLSRTIKLLSSIGAVEEGVARSHDTGRMLLTVVPSDRFSSYVEQIPEWSEAIETKQLEDRILEVAEQRGLTRNQALEDILQVYQQNTSPTEQ
jgi:hypothetical protein